MTKDQPGQPAWWVRARRPRPHTFAMSNQDLRDFEAVVAGGGFQDRSKATRAMIRQFTDASIKTALGTAPKSRAPKGSGARTTVSVTLDNEDVEILDRWVAKCGFDNRSALLRAMISHLRRAGAKRGA